MPKEETPLLGGYYDQHGNNIHQQFCLLVGIPPSNLKKGQRPIPPNASTLYGRAIEKRDAQNTAYIFTATLSSTLLLTEVVIGTALTALGASESSHILIAVFGALNTIIAGLVGYLNSRGQPMRARMFRDDLDRVVDEIENSETMWLGISYAAHGYDGITVDHSVSVRSEVARLKRLYDKAMRSNTMNDPDIYMNVSDEGGTTALRARAGSLAVVHAPSVLAPALYDSTAVVAPPPTLGWPNPDQTPETALPKPKDDLRKGGSNKEDADVKFAYMGRLAIINNQLDGSDLRSASNEGSLSS